MKTPKIAYKKLLYATDLSESGRAAFPYAASIAHRFEAELTVFHVAKPPEFEHYLVGYIDEALWERIKTQELEEAKNTLVNRKRDDAVVRDMVEQFCQETLAKHDSHPYVVYNVKVAMGEPVKEIVREAEENEYDLVVVGKHGAGLIDEAVIGTTARRVLRRCGKPVLVVPLPE